MLAAEVNRASLVVLIMLVAAAAVGGGLATSETGSLSCILH